MAIIGQPSIYGPTRLWGPITLGSLACVYGPGTGVGTVRIDGLTVTNILSNSTLAPGVSFFLGPSGFTGAATGAYILNVSPPADGLPLTIIPNLAAPILMRGSDVIHSISSVASGYVSYGFGIEMQ